ncbi:MAG: lamin tail domain-containing protein [Oligoflexia bacterium]|nr:lamin tail domain-containing protein [Oligoflexia bacterium]
MGFFVSEPAGGAGSGVWVYHGYSSGVKVNQGDLVDIIGILNEYADSSDTTGGTVTEVTLSASEFLTVTGTGTVPDAITLTVDDLADDTTAEAYEGVLVRVDDVTVTATGLDYGEWQVDDSLLIDDLLYSFAGLAPGDTFTAIDGIVHYGYGNYKIEPRSADDFQGYEAAPCPADRCVDDLADGDLVITEVLFDPQTGPDDSCEWIELYNASGGTVELQGLVVGDNDTSDGEVTASAIMAPDSYEVIARSSEADWAVDCAAMYGVMTPLAWYGNNPNLSNSGDPVEVRRSDDSVIDGIPSYDSSGDGWQLDAGYLDAVSNDDDAYWCAPTQILVKSSKAVDYGTPGVANDFCVGR